MYVSEDDTTQVSSFFMDLNKITTKLYSDQITILIYYDSYYHYGSYKIIIDGDIRKKNIIMHRLTHKPDMLDISTLEQFLIEGHRDYPAESYAIFFGMHCSGWYLIPKKLIKESLVSLLWLQ